MNSLDCKDVKPEETIKNITKILSDLNIFLIERKWSNLGNKIHSVSISDITFENIIVNGKGVSKIAALASAYAEFIERLQNRHLHFTRTFGLKQETNTYRVIPDLKNISIDYNFFKNNDLFFRSIFRSTDYRELKKLLINGNKYNMKCLPFYNLNNNAVNYLPFDFLFYSCQSNGMCSGNSKEEAIVQGICEIFERYAIRKIFFKKIIPPSISLSSLKELSVYNLTKEIYELGFRLIVKDCSFNNKIPVVGVILLTEGNKKMKVSFGSHPIFEIALERCLTELFQGIKHRELEEFMYPIENDMNNSYEKIEQDFIKFITDSSGRLHESFIQNKTTVTIPNIFQKTYRNNHDLLLYLKNIVLSLDRQLYIRDVSFLGFPSFYIYIPGMSEIKRLNFKSDRYITQSSLFLKKCLLNLKKTSNKNLAICAQILNSALADNTFYRTRDSYIRNDLTGIILKKNSDWYLIDYEFMLALIYFRIRNYKMVNKYLNIWINENSKILKNLEYFKCAALFFKLKSNNFSNREIKKQLLTHFSNDLVNDITTTLCNPKNAFKYHNLPECGECTKCSIKSDCRFDEFKKINIKIIEKIKNFKISQIELSKLFYQNSEMKKPIKLPAPTRVV